jgi:3-oxoadipate enol-lactonase
VNLSNPRRVNRPSEDVILELASEDPTIRQKT